MADFFFLASKGLKEDTGKILVAEQGEITLAITIALLDAM